MPSQLGRALRFIYSNRTQNLATNYRLLKDIKPVVLIQLWRGWKAAGISALASFPSKSVVISFHFLGFFALPQLLFPDYIHVSTNSRPSCCLRVLKAEHIDRTGENCKLSRRSRGGCLVGPVLEKKRKKEKIEKICVAFCVFCWSWLSAESCSQFCQHTRVCARTHRHTRTNKAKLNWTTNINQSATTANHESKHLRPFLFPRGAKKEIINWLMEQKARLKFCLTAQRRLDSGATSNAAQERSKITFERKKKENQI